MRVRLTSAGGRGPGAGGSGAGGSGTAAPERDLRARRVPLSPADVAAVAAALPGMRPLLRIVQPATSGGSSGSPLRDGGVPAPPWEPAVATTFAVLLDPEVLVVAVGCPVAGGTRGRAGSGQPPAGTGCAAVLAAAGGRLAVLRRSAGGVELSAAAAASVVPELLRVLALGDGCGSDAHGSGGRPAAGPAGAPPDAVVWSVRGRARAGRAGWAHDLVLCDRGGWLRWGEPTGRAGSPGWEPASPAQVARGWTAWLLSARAPA